MKNKKGLCKRCGKGIIYRHNQISLLSNKKFCSSECQMKFNAKKYTKDFYINKGKQQVIEIIKSTLFFDKSQIQAKEVILQRIELNLEK